MKVVKKNTASKPSMHNVQFKIFKQLALEQNKRGMFENASCGLIENGNILIF